MRSRDAIVRSAKATVVTGDKECACLHGDLEVFEVQLDALLDEEVGKCRVAVCARVRHDHISCEPEKWTIRVSWNRRIKDVAYDRFSVPDNSSPLAEVLENEGGVYECGK